MVVRFEIKIEDRGFRRLMKNFGPRVMTNLKKANLEFGNIVVDSMKREFLTSPRGNPLSRAKAASRMRAHKSKNQVLVSIPRSAHFVDMARPHYVSLKRGRIRLRRWTDTYFGTRRKTGLSHIYRDKRGRIEYRKGRRSFLFVTPDPFVNKAFHRVRKRHQTLLKRAIRETIGGK